MDSDLEPVGIPAPGDRLTVGRTPSLLWIGGDVLEQMPLSHILDFLGLRPGPHLASLERSVIMGEEEIFRGADGEIWRWLRYCNHIPLSIDRGPLATRAAELLWDYGAPRPAIVHAESVEAEVIFLWHRRLYSGSDYRRAVATGRLDELRAAALLHDVLKDRIVLPLTWGQIWMGGEVKELVHELTRSHARGTYRQYVEALSEDAMRVKLADVLVNRRRPPRGDLETRYRWAEGFLREQLGVPALGR